MFERAQERMQHQFQQLKVFPSHSLNSSPKEAPGEAADAGTAVVVWAQGEPDGFCKVGPTGAPSARRGRRLALGVQPHRPHRLEARAALGP